MAIVEKVHIIFEKTINIIDNLFNCLLKKDFIPIVKKIITNKKIKNVVIDPAIIPLANLIAIENTKNTPINPIKKN
jgi:hypothetical protein